MYWLVGYRCNWANAVDVHRPQICNKLYSHLCKAQIRTQRLHNYPQYLQAVHINAQSLRRHIDQIRKIFQSQKVDIIAISETWLKPNIRSKDVALPGYKLLRNDRLHQNGGGVAIYVRIGLKVKFLYASPSGYLNRPEFIFIKISLLNSNLLFGVCYRPPKTQILVEFEKILLLLILNHNHLLIMGDFNANILDKKLDYDRNQVSDLFKRCNMTVLPLAPTHHLASSHSLIDLIVTSDLRHIVHHGQLPIPHISWHDLIYCVTGLKTSLSTTEFITHYEDLKIASALKYT